MTKNEIQSAVHRLIKLIENRYVFPDIGAQISEFLTNQLESNAYDSVKTGAELAKVLSQDLQSINHDRHLCVVVKPDRVSSINNSTDDDRLQDEPESKDCGFNQAEILDGSIGYLKLTEFADTRYGGDIAVSTMQKFVGCQSLIFDLRENGGGSPKMVQLLTTYLLGHEPIHLNNFYMRETDTIDQFWILPYVPGARLTETDVYVLTSRDTFSAAEEFCYNLQNLKRGTIIGETTGGGAQPGDEHVLGDQLCVFIPHGRAVNPISGTNWEGIGVVPDIQMPAAEALDTALKMARKKAEANESHI
jgi:C-terminal processing protease CtpA/Prc